MLEPLIAAKAKGNQVARKGEQAGATPQKSADLIDPVETRQEIAKAANVSHDTVARRVAGTAHRGKGEGESGDKDRHLSEI